MESLAPELLESIFLSACTDGGFTGCALSLVSKRIRAASYSARYFSVALLSQSPTQLHKFLAHLVRERAASPAPAHSGVQSPGSQGQGLSPTGSPGQHPFAMSNPAALAYAAQMGMPQMSMGMGMGINPMLQMQMNMGNAFANPHAIQSVMRHPSPGPMPVGQNYMNMGGMSGF